MRRLLAGLFFSFCLLLPNNQALAASFVLSSYDVTSHDVDPGLRVTATNLLALPHPFTLNSIGDQDSATLFHLSTDEVAVNLDDWIPYPVSVALHFSSPVPFSAVQTGNTGAFWFLLGFGYVSWDAPAIVSFGNGGL